nr:coat protein [Cressdnaviricota sp.]
MAWFRRRGYGGYRRRYRPRRYTRTVYVRAPARRRRRTTTRRRTVRKAKAPKMTRFQVAQVNPFHPDAVGAKIPDANSMPSCAVQIADSATVAVDAVFGAACVAFRPYVTGTLVTATPSAATTWAWTAGFGGQSNSARQSSITANFSLVRPVAHGVRITSSLSPNTVTGFVHVAIFPGNVFNVTTWDFPTTTTQMINGTIYKKVPLALLCGKSLTVVNRTIDFSNEKYNDPASDNAATGTDMSFNNTGWGTIIVAVEGAPVSSNAIQVEGLFHLECIPLKTGVADASGAAEFNPTTIRVTSNFVNSSEPIVVSDSNENEIAAERLRGFLGGMYDAAADVAGSYAYDAGRAVVGAGLSAAARAFGGTRGIYTGNLASVRTLMN